jgi:hypothetical protein
MIIKENCETYLKHLTRLKKDFRYRESINYTEIVKSNGQKVISTKNNQFAKGLYLFSMVKRDIERYIKENGYIIPFQKLPVNFKNSDFSKNIDKVVGIDIDNAYWTMAWLKGYISENTYKKGLEKKEFKPIRLSALSTLGKGKTYKVFEAGKYIKDEVVKKDIELENFYLDIRYSTYGVLSEVANDLGEDFYCWKTDCIYFFETKQNKELVRNALESYGFDCKIELLDRK